MPHKPKDIHKEQFFENNFICGTCWTITWAIGVLLGIWIFTFTPAYTAFMQEQYRGGYIAGYSNEIQESFTTEAISKQYQIGELKGCMECELKP